MNDREVERLVRMALEADELERSALLEPAPLRLVGGGARRWLTGLGVATAAAASLATAFFIMGRSVAPPAPPVLANAQPRHTEPADPHTAIVSAPKNDNQSVVMAVFKGPDGHCSCVDLKPHEWANGRHLAQIEKHELRDVAMKAACATDAYQVLVVAMEGKRDALPATPENAEAIVARVEDVTAANRHTDVSSYAYAAMPDLAPGTTVVAEKFTVRPAPVLERAKALVGLNLP